MADSATRSSSLTNPPPKLLCTWAAGQRGRGVGAGAGRSARAAPMWPRPLRRISGGAPTQPAGTHHKGAGPRAQQVAQGGALEHLIGKVGRLNLHRAGRPAERRRRSVHAACQAAGRGVQAPQQHEKEGQKWTSGRGPVGAAVGGPARQPGAAHERAAQQAGTRPPGSGTGSGTGTTSCSLAGCSRGGGGCGAGSGAAACPDAQPSVQGQARRRQRKVGSGGGRRRLLGAAGADRIT